MGRRSYCKGLLLLCLLLQSGCFLPYVLTQAYYQGELLGGAKPVGEVIFNPKLTKQEQDQLILIGALKRFTVSHMGMNESGNYSTFNPNWSRNLYIVSGSKELAFESYTWKFPIIGKVPYLGYFNKRQALGQESRLKAKGYDTLLRPAGGYSTLGYFNDPIWPQMLKRSVPSLVELIVHELAHSTLWFTGQSDFNESFANFVGHRGALEFLERNFGKNSSEIVAAKDYALDYELYMKWLAEVHDRLEAIYKSPLSDTQKRKRKEEEIARSKESFVIIHFRSKAFQEMDPPELNNAVLMMSRRYNTGQDEFEKLYVRVKYNWTEFYLQLKTLQGKADPFLELKGLAK